MVAFNFMRALRNIKAGILGSLEITERRAQKPTHPYLQAVSVFINIVQMLSFIVSDFSTSSWPSSLSPVETISSFTNFKGYRRYISAGYMQAAVWLALIWTTTLIAIMIWGCWCFAKNSYPVLWPLHVLKAMGTFSSNLLFVSSARCAVRR